MIGSTASKKSFEIANKSNLIEDDVAGKSARGCDVGRDDLGA